MNATELVHHSVWTKLSPLHIAVILADETDSTLSHVLDGEYVNPNIQDRWGRTALHVVAEENKGSLPKTVEKLVRQTNLDREDMSGRTVVHTITRYNGSEELLSLVLRAGANVDKLCGLGKTPLDYAIEHKASRGLFRGLLRYGATLSITHLRKCEEFGRADVKKVLNDFRVVILLCSIKRTHGSSCHIAALPAELIREVGKQLLQWN